MELIKIEVKNEHKFIEILEKTDAGENHCRFLTPDMDVSGEASQIQETAEKVWTNEVKDTYAKHQEEAEKNSPFNKG